MYTLPLFKKLLNLNWKKVTIMWFNEEAKRIIFKIRWKYNNTICPNCGLITSKRQDKKLHKQNRLIPHMPYGWDKMIFLELHKRYFRCTNCKTQFYEKFDFESQFWIYTTHFEQYIQWNWWHVSWNKLSELYQSSNSVIFSILERIDIDLINKRWIDIIQNSTKNFKFTNALTESINNLCKVIKRVSHWFKNKDMYIRKICARFCLKELQI